MIRVLVVDDEEAFVGMIKTYLSQSKDPVIEVDGTFTAAKAKELIVSDPYDVLVFDQILRSGTGVDLLRWLRGEKIMTPVILTSGIDEVCLRILGMESEVEGLGPVETIYKGRGCHTNILEAVKRLSVADNTPPDRETK